MNLKVFDVFLQLTDPIFRSPSILHTRRLQEPEVRHVGPPKISAENPVPLQFHPVTTVCVVSAKSINRVPPSRHGEVSHSLAPFRVEPVWIMGSLGMSVERETIVALGISSQNAQGKLLPTFSLPFRHLTGHVLFAEIITNSVSVFFVTDKTNAKDKTRLTHKFGLAKRMDMFFHGFLPTPIRIDMIVMMD